MTDGRKMLANHIVDKGFVSFIWNIILILKDCILFLCVYVLVHGDQKGASGPLALEFQVFVSGLM